MSTVQPATAATFESEVAKGERFRFGKNWQQFLSVLNDQRIELAVGSLKTMLGVPAPGKKLLSVISYSKD